jgi:hypothetical protein
MADESLVCPSCGSTHPADERFCPQCGMPLVHADRTGVDEPVSAAHERARKIKPQFTEGDLVRVAGARHQAEAEFVQGMLLEEGIPSMLRRTRGFDVPDMLAAGPRDVMVPASGAAAARCCSRPRSSKTSLRPTKPSIVPRGCWSACWPSSPWSA